MPPKKGTQALQVLPPLPPSQQDGLRATLQACYQAGLLEENFQRFLAVMDPLNCLGELALARTLLQDFLDHYEEQNAWFKAWAEVMGKDGVKPPVRILYPEQALKYIERITETANHIQRIKESDALSRMEMRWTVVQMGQVVEEEVAHATTDDPEWQESLLRRIRNRWMKIWV